MRPLLVRALLAQLVVLAGCGVGVIERGSSEAMGSTGAKCYPNDTCDEGLICSASKTCELSTAPTCEGVVCSGHGTCADTGGSAVCTCNQGYVPRGLACVTLEGSSGTLSDGGTPHDATGSQHDAGSSQHDATGAQHDAGATQHDAASSQHDAASSQHDAASSQHDAGSSTGCQEVPDEVFGAEPNPTCNPIGGGEGYSDAFSATDPRVTAVVRTKAELLSALGSAASGDVVFVAGDAVIDMNGSPFAKVREGITVASDRGRSGSKGALIKMSTPGDNWETPIFSVQGDNVRFTGLQLEGENYVQDYGNNDVYPGSIGEQHYLVGIRSAQYGTPTGGGFSGLEVDNCELRGFAWAAIMTMEAPNVWVHHNYIHNCEARGEGYGYNIDGGNALVEGNIFDYNRHSITGAGYAGEQYEARYNIIVGNGDAIGAAQFDVHQDGKGGSFAGEKFLIHHNTFKYGVGINGNTVSSIHIRHAATIGTYIYNNRFEAVATVLPGGVPIYQTNSSQHMFATNNLWMDVLYPSNATIVWFQ
jgi:hypothetical protein